MASAASQTDTANHVEAPAIASQPPPAPAQAAPKQAAPTLAAPALAAPTLAAAGQVAAGKAAAGKAQPTPAPFASNLKPIWCPGCGSYSVLATLRKVLQSLQLAPESVLLTSGIGCSSRLPAYVGTYGYHTVHGRALPVALGSYLASPDLTHIVVGGDGDIFSIGGGHLPHIARRNPNITVFVLDNEIYGLTKGQASPTTPPDVKSKSMPNRIPEPPLNPALMCLAYDVSFFARAYAGKVPELAGIITEAIRHPGLAIVQVFNPCVTFHNTWETWNQMVQPLPEGHDSANRMAAMALAADEEHLYTGIFYRTVRPTLIDTIRANREQTRARVKPDLDELIRQYA